jgi:hypothetical protein
MASDIISVAESLLQTVRRNHEPKGADIIKGQTDTTAGGGDFHVKDSCQS